MTAALEAVGLTKTYGDAPAVGPVDLDVAAGRAGRAARPQRQRQDDAAADGRRAARADGRHRRRARPAPSGRSRPGPRRRTSATSRCSTTTSACGSTSSTSPGCTAPTTGSTHADRPARRRSAWPTAPTTCRRRSAAGCARRRRSRWPSSGRSSCCSSTSRSSASTATGRDALLELFRRAHRDGAALVVATHELTTVGAAAAPRRPARRRAWCSTAPPTDADVDALVASDAIRQRALGWLQSRPCTSSTPSASRPTRPPRSPPSSPRSPARAGTSSPSCRPGSDITAFLKRDASTGADDTSPTGTPPSTATPPAAAVGRRRGQRAGRLGHRAGVGRAAPSWRLGRRRPTSVVGRRPRDTRRRQRRGARRRARRRPRRRRRPQPATPVGAGRVVRRPGRPLRAALLGRLGVDRARLARRPAVHRPARRLSAGRRAGAGPHR